MGRRPPQLAERLVRGKKYLARARAWTERSLSKIAQCGASRSPRILRRLRPQDDQDDADEANAAVTVAVAAKAATESTKQEDYEDDDEDKSERDGAVSFGNI
jgi:hypothetical protein